MDIKAFYEMKLAQESHWWFKGKRAIIEELLNTLSLPSDAKILEIGCGTGSNLTLLSKFGDLTAIEIDDDARNYAAEYSGFPVQNGWLPDGLFNIIEKRFNVICMFDVLEHISDDVNALIALKKHLISDTSNKGKLFLTVPAYQWMYSQHDKELSHFRRYSKNELLATLNEAGYKINCIGYMNTLLFPLMLLFRLINKLGLAKNRDNEIPSHTINSLLFKIFSSEKYILPKLKMPFGGSVYAICEEKTNA